MIKKLNDFEKNMLLMAGSGCVGMIYSYILYENIINNAFKVSFILTAFFLGAFVLSFYIRRFIGKKEEERLKNINTVSKEDTKKYNVKERKKGFYYGNKKR